MNDLVRELVELHGYGAILKCIPEYEHEARRLDRFTKFMKRQESKKKKSKLSFDVSTLFNSYLKVFILF